jgi:hypothetical protein
MDMMLVCSEHILLLGSSVLLPCLKSMKIENIPRSGIFSGYGRDACLF